MLAVLLTLSAVTPPRDLPDMVPIFCRDSDGQFQPVVDTTYGDLKAAFRRQFGFSSRLIRTTPASGTLSFYGAGRPTETIRYQVMPYNDVTPPGIALLSMAVRLRGSSDDLHGSDMCWQTFSIIHTR